MKENVGSQDQIACALGGLNIIDFQTNGTWRATSTGLELNSINKINEYLFPIFTGVSRLSSNVSAELVRNLGSHSRIMQRNIELVEDAINIFKHEADYSGIGELLNESWSIKRQLNSASVNSSLEEIWAKGMQSGASGGKILGAGGGGFLLFWVHPEKREKFMHEFKIGIHVPVRISNGGTQVILDEHAR